MINCARSLCMAVVAARLVFSPAFAQEQEQPEPEQILFTNASVFDGFAPDLIEGANVLVEGNVITRVSTSAIDAPNAKVIDATGKYLTPGLIDMHTHSVFFTPEGSNSYQDEWDAPAGGAMAAQGLRDDALMKGITTVREIAGNTRGMARAMQRGLLVGPRIYTSGAVLSHTGGHGDWGDRNDMETSDYGAQVQHSLIVNNRDDVILASRRNYRNGAHFTKIMAGGGVASRFDPLDIMGATQEEMEAAVEIATDYGTYVAIHAYHDKSYQRAIDAGVRSFEHGFLVSEDIVNQLAAKGEEIVWSFQCYMSVKSFGTYESMPEFFTHEQKLKGVAVGKGARNAAMLMYDAGVFMTGGADMFGQGLQDIRKQDNTWKVNEVGYPAAHVCIMHTGNAGKVLKWSGPLDPYPTYALGTIAPNSYADILLWDENPVEDIDVILDESKLHYIMKDGLTYKNIMVDPGDSDYLQASTSNTRYYNPIP